MTTVPFRSKTSAAALVARLMRDEHAPMSAMVEIADRCNEACVHCYQVQGQKGELSTEEWKKIFDELAEMGVLFLTISGGEATLRKDFLELVEHARARRFAVKVFTNGLTMTRELAARLGELAVQEVQISLYSHRAEVHDAITRVPGSWERTVNGARALMEAGCKVVLKSPLMSVNADEIDAYIDFVSGLGADYMLDPHVDPREDGDRSTEQLRIDDETYLRARQHPRLSPGPAKKGGGALDRSVCGACSGNVHVEANGELRPCTQLTVPVGNALEGVRDAWSQNEEGRAIRKLTWADLHGCRECDLRPYCSRCFANAQVEAGDALGPYETACHKAKLQYRLVHGAPPRIAPAPELGRDGSIGPYREEAGGFRCIEDVVTDADRALAQAHGWIRPERKLVQIARRRPRIDAHGD